MHTVLKHLSNSSIEEPIFQYCTNDDTPLNRLISLITQSMDAEKIYLFGTYPAPPDGLELEYDLLILVNETGNRPMDQLESLVQNRSRNVNPVLASVFRISHINQLISNGNNFFSQTCVPEKLIYDAGRIEIAKSTVGCVSGGCCEQQSVFDSFMAHAEGFLDGAARYTEKDEYPLACFMLHQAVEQALSALLVPLMQFHLKTHNLGRLLRIARRFSTEVYNVFPRRLKQDAQRFYMLQKAYIHGRYSSNFPASAEDTATLLEQCNHLLQQVADAYNKHSNSGATAA